MELIHGSVSRGRVEGGDQLGDGLPPPAHRQVHQQLKHCNTVSVVLGRSHLKLCDVDQCQVFKGDNRLISIHAGSIRTIYKQVLF